MVDAVKGATTGNHSPYTKYNLLGWCSTMRRTMTDERTKERKNAEFELTFFAESG